jgi:nucleotide-binding universal stress UspA family protein
VRYLVIPDQEDELDALVAKIIELAAVNPNATFDLLVPLGHRSHSPVALKEARLHAETHLQDAQRLLSEHGISAEGRVAGHRLAWTIDDALADGRYDAIILSTPSQPIRSAVRLDVASHVRRTFGLPVIHVVTPSARWPQPPPTPT